MINNISEISDMVSKFVESRVADRPNDDNIDLWFEKLFAALFSSSFILFLRYAHGFTKSEEEFNKSLENFINEISKQASKWIEFRWDESVGLLKSGGKINLQEDLVLIEIRQRLSMYFSIGLKAIIDKNFDMEMARSHSCFVVLSEIIFDLAKKGEFTTTESAKLFLENTMEVCDNLSGGMGEILKNYDR